MPYSAKQLTRFEVQASDGRIGHVADLYFDDERLVVRHLVVDTGGWITGRQVLISPHAVERVDPQARTVATHLTRQQIEKAPGIDTDKPVSRQQEMEWYDYYGYPYYWSGYGLWGAMAYPIAYPTPTDPAQPEHPPAPQGSSDPHLRSSGEVIGYAIGAVDGSIGHLSNLLIDERSWALATLVIDTRNWLPGRHVCVDARNLHAVDWARHRIEVNLTRDAVKSSAPCPPGV